MSTDLVLKSPDEAFVVASRICRSNLVPAAYRGKETELAIALMFGAEVGLPPMASMQRVVVIEGKPGLDAQGMVAVIRGAGHSISGDVTSERAIVKGKRADNGDEISVTFTFAQATQIGLTRKQVWKDYPQAMLWARGVSQLARMLFADVLMGLSYTPDELEEIAGNNGAQRPVLTEQPAAEEKPSCRRPPPGAKAEETVTEDGEIVDAEVVPTPEPEPEPALNKDQLSRLAVLLAKVPSLTTPAEKRAYVADFIGRPIDSTKDLTADEYGRLRNELEAITGEAPPRDDDEGRPFE